MRLETVKVPDVCGNMLSSKWLGGRRRVGRGSAREIDLTAAITVCYISLLKLV